LLIPIPRLSRESVMWILAEMFADAVLLVYGFLEGSVENAPQAAEAAVAKEEAPPSES
jgi:hypothetical protein